MVTKNVSWGNAGGPLGGEGVRLLGQMFERVSFSPLQNVRQA